MYDHMLARSFSKNEQKRLGNCAFVICIFAALSLWSVLRPSFHLSILNLEVSTTSGPNMVRQERVRNGSTLSVRSYVEPGGRTVNPQPSGAPARVGGGNDRFNGSRGSSHHRHADCSLSEAKSDHCKTDGTVRVDGRSSVIFTSSSARNVSWVVRPYGRKGTVAMEHVREWTIRAVDGQENMPSCNTTQADPAVLFSTGGFSGNHFHDFSDIVIPLFTTSRAFNRKVHFLVTDYKSWWISKFRGLLSQLSDHEVVDVDRLDRVHCYPNAVIGLRSHKELGIDASRSPNGYSVKDFRSFLRSAYSLERRTAMKLKPPYNDHQRPRLMIISRRTSRRLKNEARVAKMAETLGYEVVTASVNLTTNLSNFARVVNSCDVFMGVHGAGLTNMVFLPDNAVVIQVVPLGGLEGIAQMDFGEPSKEMNLRYLRYSVRVKESSLATQYATDDVVLMDPISIHRQGWDAIRTTYLDKQDITLDVRRFRQTLLKALKLLRH